MTKQQPLAEVFGYPLADQGVRAVAARKNRLCPFNNKVPNCTKDKAKNPLGVCSIYHNGAPVITCPVRFRENWQITSDAATFFFGADVAWSSLTEIRLNDAHGKSAGNVDLVLVAYDDRDRVIDFGALEVQAVYISGNVRDPFEQFIRNPKQYAEMNWAKEAQFPRPDYLSSSRKRLAPQLLFKGGIFKSWGKKSAVALNSTFFKTLPALKRVSADRADIAWLVYDLIPHPTTGRYELTKVDEVFTLFDETVRQITTTQAGSIESFKQLLQSKLDEQLESAPITRSLDSPI